MVSPYSAGTFTLQEAPSFAWRTNGLTFSRKPRERMLRIGNAVARGLTAATWCWAAHLALPQYPGWRLRLMAARTPSSSSARTQGDFLLMVIEQGCWLQYTFGPCYHGRTRGQGLVDRAYQESRFRDYRGRINSATLYILAPRSQAPSSSRLSDNDA